MSTKRTPITITLSRNIAEDLFNWMNLYQESPYIVEHQVAYKVARLLEKELYKPKDLSCPSKK